GMLATPYDDPKASARDARWRQFDEAGGVMAATLVPADAVVLAIENGPERSFLVRINAEGVARIIAEIESAAGDDGAEEPCTVTHLRWNTARGCVVVTGNFGTQAFRPAPP